MGVSHRRGWTVLASSVAAVLLLLGIAKLVPDPAPSAVASPAPAGSGTAQAESQAPPQAAPPPDVPGKRALVVGISRYPEETGWVDLPGARVDALQFADLLQGRFGFRAEDIRLVLDEQATYQAITQGFREWLVQDAGPETLAVFYFAGHGSRVFDDEEVEIDFRDETLVPYDTLGHEEPRRDVRDDELRVLFDQLAERTPHGVGIFDCCHSGTATRDVPSGAYVERRVPEYVPEGSPSPPDRPADPRHAEQVVDLGAAGAQPTILSACLDHQSALEDTRLGRGVFSSILEEVLKTIQPGETWLRVLEQVRGRMRELGIDQEPALHGNATARVFDQRFARLDLSFPTLDYHRDKGVRVRGGTLQGIRVGDELLLRPTTGGGGFGAIHARVTSVGALESYLEPERLLNRPEIDAMFQGRYHAEILERAGREFGFALFSADDEACAAVVAALGESPWYRPAASAAEADLLLGPGSEGPEVHLASGARLLPHPARLAPGIPASWRTDPRMIADDLRAYAVWQSVRSLVNDSSSLQEHVSLEVVPQWEDARGEVQEQDTLWSRGAGGEWILSQSEQEARQREEGGGLSVLTCRLTSSHDRPLTVLAVDLLPDWGVVVLPFERTLDPGQGIDVPLEAEPAWFQGCPPESVVFFFSEEPESLAWLGSAGLRSPEDLGLPPLEGGATRSVGGGRLSTLLDAALSQSGTRSAAREDDPISVWTTLRVDFSMLPF